MHTTRLIGTLTYMGLFEQFVPIIAAISSSLVVVVLSRSYGDRDCFYPGMAMLGGRLFRGQHEVSPAHNLISPEIPISAAGFGCSS